MNTETLFNWFRDISQGKNSLEIFEELTKNKKEYKSSDFYKNTHLSIYKAYEIYIKNTENTIVQLINGEIVQDLLKGKTSSLALFLEQLMGQIDFEKIDNIIDRAADRLYDIAENNTALKDAIVKELRKVNL